MYKWKIKEIRKKQEELRSMLVGLTNEMRVLQGQLQCGAAGHRWYVSKIAAAAYIAKRSFNVTFRCSRCRLEYVRNWLKLTDAERVLVDKEMSPDDEGQ